MAESKVVLVGAGDHGRGVLEVLRRLAAAGETHSVIGFVDDSPDAGPVDGVPLLGDVGWLLSHADELDAGIFLSLANPAAKKQIAARLQLPADRFVTVVHPTAEVAPSAVIGPGSYVGAGAVIVYEAALGRHTAVNLNATVGHHVRIGDHSTVAPGANILGKAGIGEGVQVHANAVLLPGVQIGAGAVIGAGSVVLKDIPAGGKVFGNPARPLPT